MTDAWIFLSIGDEGGCDKWVPLSHLIRAADSNNHALPTIGELEHSISKLLAAGLVEAEGTRTRLTPLGCTEFHVANRGEVGHIQRMLELGELWQARNYPPPAVQTWRLDPQVYRAAVSDYHEWFQGAWARIKAAADAERSREGDAT